MHFEYISDAVSNGLMRVQLDTGIPVIFGVLTVLTVTQALERAGLKHTAGLNNTGHSEWCFVGNSCAAAVSLLSMKAADEHEIDHGEDWALAAVELSAHCSEWANGQL